MGCILASAEHAHTTNRSHYHLRRGTVPVVMTYMVFPLRNRQLNHRTFGWSSWVVSRRIRRRAPSQSSNRFDSQTGFKYDGRSNSWNIIVKGYFIENKIAIFITYCSKSSSNKGNEYNESAFLPGQIDFSRWHHQRWGCERHQLPWITFSAFAIPREDESEQDWRGRKIKAKSEFPFRKQYYWFVTICSMYSIANGDKSDKKMKLLWAHWEESLM